MIFSTGIPDSVSQHSIGPLSNVLCVSCHSTGISSSVMCVFATPLAVCYVSIRTRSGTSGNVLHGCFHPTCSSCTVLCVSFHPRHCSARGSQNIRALWGTLNASLGTLISA